MIKIFCNKCKKEIEAEDYGFYKGYYLYGNNIAINAESHPMANLGTVCDDCWGKIAEFILKEE